MTRFSARVPILHVRVSQQELQCPTPFRANMMSEQMGFPSRWIIMGSFLLKQIIFISYEEDYD